MDSPSTTISTASSRVGMRARLDHRKFGEAPHARVDVVEEHGSVDRHIDIVAVPLNRARPYDAQIRIGLERGQRGHLRGARPADAPGLLQHAEPGCTST